MRSAEIARIAEDELAGQAPCLPQSVFRLRDGPDYLVMTPIGNDMNAGGRRAQGLNLARHQIANNDRGFGLAQGAIAQRYQTRSDRAAHERHPEFDGGFRINI